jgi:transcriptional regulator with XRE-family HTH domain
MVKALTGKTRIQRKGGAIRADRAPPPIRAWRESLNMTRPEVVSAIASRYREYALMDQATLAKWESGRNALKVEHLRLLAEIYGVPAENLLHHPDDKHIPALLKEAMDVISTRNAAEVRAWLQEGMTLTKKTRAEKAGNGGGKRSAAD